ncbi:MAG TPA: efflux RND transporter periplasmic adaptor subunit [Bryobacteraceae bacterium]|nr:efflux RND transporter periplasmic adaptor subunit [Bryobacteraceae bacterium]
MKIRYAYGALLIVLSMGGCSRPSSPPAQTAPPAAAAPAVAPSDRDIVLDLAAQKQAGLMIETVRTRSLPQVLRANGRVAVDENHTWRVGAVTEGRIVRVLVNAGDRIDQGQILARMHSHMIHESRAEYRKAVGELARLKGAEAYALRVRDRARRLYQIKAASLEQTEHAETELRNAQVATENGNIEVERTRRHLVEFLQIPPDLPDHDPQTGHEEDADLIPIKSPARGTLMQRNVTPGTVVQPSGDLFLVSDLSRLWAIAAVNEEYLPKLRVGMPVQVYVQAYPGEGFPGRIGRIGDELDPTTRTAKVRVELSNRDGRLKPEMYATAEIELGGSEPALFVPQEAPQEVSGQTVVFVRTAADRFELRPVEIGRTSDGAREIVRGLKAGDSVVTHGSFALKSQLLKATLGQE